MLFSDAVSQCVSLQHDLECLSATNAQKQGSSTFWDHPHFGFVECPKQGNQGPDQLSSTVSSSCGSTTDEEASVLSLESPSTPRWLKSPSEWSPSTSATQHASVPAWARPLSGSANTPVGVDSPHRSALSMLETPSSSCGVAAPAHARQQASPLARCHPVAVKALLDAIQSSGRRPKACKVTQQQTVTITNTVHITLEV